MGSVVHYYQHVNAAIVQIDSGEIRPGDTLQFQGHTTDFRQRVSQIEHEHQSIDVARAGQTVGIKVGERVREHDEVFKVKGSKVKGS